MANKIWSKSRENRSHSLQRPVLRKWLGNPKHGQQKQHDLQSITDPLLQLILLVYLIKSLFVLFFLFWGERKLLLVKKTFVSRSAFGCMVERAHNSPIYDWLQNSVSKRSWLCHKNRHVKRIPMTPHNQYVSFKSAYHYCQPKGGISHVWFTQTK